MEERHAFLEFCSSPEKGILEASNSSRWLDAGKREVISKAHLSAWRLNQFLLSPLWLSTLDIQLYWAAFEPNLYLEKEFCFWCSFFCLLHNIFYYTSVPLNKYLQHSLCRILITTSQLQGKKLAGLISHMGGAYGALKQQPWDKRRTFFKHN